jgi:amino acid transporter
MKELKALGLQLGVTVLALVALAISLGWVVWQFGGAGVVRVVRDISIIVLALFSLIMALVWAVIYAGAAWAIDRFGSKAIGGVRWAGQKSLWVEERVGIGMERFVARPFAGAVRAAATASAFVRTFFAGPPARLDMAHEVGGWRTFRNRLRGRAVLPPTRQEPAARRERDVQPGPGIAA